MLSGSVTGKSDLGIFIIWLFSSYAIGIGHPQYLCLETPQSFNLKFIRFFPFFLFSKMLIAFEIDCSGTLSPSKNFELMIIPCPI